MMGVLFFQFSQRWHQQHRPTLIRYRHLLTVLGIFFFIVFTLLCVDRSTYNNSTPYWSNAIWDRCESVFKTGRENRFLRQPANAMSNLIFVLVGLYVTSCAWFDWKHFRVRSHFSLDASSNSSSRDRSGAPRPRRNSITRMAGGLVLHPILQLSLASSLYFIGYGSWLYHATSGSDMGGRLDLYGIFVICFGVFWCLGLYGILGVLGCNATHDNVNAGFCFLSWFVWCVVGWFGWDTFLWMGSWHAEYFLLIGFMGCMIGSFLILVILLRIFKIESSFFSFVPLSLISLLAAVLAWAPEEFTGKCIYPFPGGPASFFQLHGIWHALLAMCICWIFIFVRCIGMGEEVLATFKMSKLDFLLLREKHLDAEHDGERASFTGSMDEEEAIELTVNTESRESTPTEKTDIQLHVDQFYSNRSANI